MKKTYIAPSMVATMMACENIIAASFKVNSDVTVNTKNEGVQLGNTQRGEWGNLWK